MDMLNGLNQEQEKAVKSTARALLIVAGAGTGKTTVLVRRIAHLLQNKQRLPAEILAVTFTEKASQELLDRIEAMTEQSVLDMSVGTFHSICERILRQYGQDIGLPNNFRVITDTEAWMLVRNNFEKFDLKYYRPRGNPTSFIKSLLRHFSRCKDELITTDTYANHVQEQALNKDTADEIFAQELERQRELSSAYFVYEKLLLDNSLLDFGSLLSYTYELLSKRTNILEQLQEQYKHIFVDEFQDTNYAQYAIVKLLSQKSSITVVGDDNQSIYAFRGAAVENIIEFSSDFEDAQKVVLTQNYRSAQNILDASYELIQKNNPDTLESQLGISKKLISNLKEQGSIQHVHSKDEYSECVRIAELLKQQHSADMRWCDMAILLRAHSHGDLLRKVLPKKGVPLAVHGKDGFLHHPVVLYCVNVFEILHNSHNSSALYSLLTAPPLSFVHEQIVELTEKAKKAGISLYNAMPKDSGFYVLCKEVVALQDSKNVSELLVLWLEKTGMMEYWKEQEQRELIYEPFVALEMFLKYVQQFEKMHDVITFESFLRFHNDTLQSGGSGIEEDVELSTDAVQMMTMHSSKGLEFALVVLPQLVHLRFPSVARKEPIPIPEELIHYARDSKTAHKLEERRIAYVAMTRAKNRLIISHADRYGEGKKIRKPSQFVEEMDLDNFSTEKVVVHVPHVDQIQSKPAPTHRLASKMSFSQVQTFRKCPQKYKYKYISRIPTRGSHALSFGLTIHNTLHQWYLRIKELRSVKQGGLFETNEESNVIPDVKELLTLYREKWIDEWYQNPEQKKEYWDHGLVMLKNYYKAHNPFARLPVALEQGFNIKIGDCTFAGRIDRIDSDDDGVIIIDYKTGKPKTRADKESSQQLMLYHIAVSKDPSLAQLGPVRGLQYWYLEDQSELNVPFTSEKLKAFEEEIIETVDQMRTSDFAATPSQMACTYCEFKSICPYRKL